MYRPRQIKTERRVKQSRNGHHPPTLAPINVPAAYLYMPPIVSATALYQALANRQTPENINVNLNVNSSTVAEQIPKNHRRTASRCQKVTRVISDTRHPVQYKQDQSSSNPAKRTWRNAERAWWKAVPRPTDTVSSAVVSRPTVKARCQQDPVQPAKNKTTAAEYSAARRIQVWAHPAKTRLSAAHRVQARAQPTGNKTNAAEYSVVRWKAMQGPWMKTRSSLSPQISKGDDAAPPHLPRVV